MQNDNEIYEEIYNEIEAWFNSGQKFKAGLQYHAKYNPNKLEIRQLGRANPSLKKSLLSGYMRKLLKFYGKKLHKPKIEKVEMVVKLTQKKLSIGQKLKAEFPKIEFKELPDTLKLLVFKRYEAKQEAIKFHELQHTAADEATRYEYARNCVEAMMENWNIWEELNHWHKYKRILEKHPVFKKNEFLEEIKTMEATLPVVEYTKQFMHIRKRARAAINEHKRKKELTPQQQTKMVEWIEKFNVVSNKLSEPLWEE